MLFPLYYRAVEPKIEPERPEEAILNISSMKSACENSMPYDMLFFIAKQGMLFCKSGIAKPKGKWEH